MSGEPIEVCERDFCGRFLQVIGRIGGRIRQKIVRRWGLGIVRLRRTGARRLLGKRLNG